MDTKRLEEGLALDERGLSEQLKDTLVLTTKIFTDWDWRLIEGLLDGPLRHPPRLLRLLKT